MISSELQRSQQRAFMFEDLRKSYQLVQGMIKSTVLSGSMFADITAYSSVPMLDDIARSKSKKKAQYVPFFFGEVYMSKPLFRH